MIKKIKQIVFKKEDGFAQTTDFICGFAISIIVFMAFFWMFLSVEKTSSETTEQKQIAREYMLLMETEGYLNSTDEANLIDELENAGLSNISLEGTTLSEVNYGDRIYLVINGTYDQSAMDISSSWPKLTDTKTNVKMTKVSTAKQ